ncbi:MAG: hypothetical protein ACI91O_000335 [Candidatus Poriferisodalaceae bacterium]|jgi:hypothetical protein
MVHDPASATDLERWGLFLDDWFATELSELPVLLDVTRDAERSNRWYVRLRGEERDVTAIWFTLGQRTLKYESYVLPSPEEKREQFFELALRQNYSLVGVQFGIGPEDALFLTGELPLHALDGDELDRIVGSIYEYVERFFRPLLRLGFGSRLPPLK